MVVLEGVYSMEGHVARFRNPRGHEGSQLFHVMDDAHGFGVMVPAAAARRRISTPPTRST